ncbi:AAA family ATPase [Nitrosomonas mobilis]|jgi:chromosome partitioning protein|uniref:Plasmid partitioning protein RepA n=1 Tax=Nitrosomonas mobilis TaxID=51642 RepID=A0A1G5SD70_9PROT|nr:AAA family ATPase [Nitrosomonas mobilis]SCZ85058.1 Plasmid partitioning protein RepA [Nitrosomonas mobilis]HNO76369.1 AAA family ATPase [Nitrosomonas mobilis]
MNTAHQSISELLRRSDQVLKAIKEQGFSPTGIKTLELRFTLQEAQDLVGRSATAIRDAEKDGRMSPPDLGPTGRRIGFTQKQLNDLRAIFGTQPYRAETDEPVIIACSSFKGGVGKSTTAVHMSQYLALQGYRVLLVDSDPQGSATSLFGYIPDLELDERDTLAPFYRDEEDTLDYAVRKTYWDSLDLVPANLLLYETEYEWMADVRGETFRYLKEALDTVKHNYDVIVIDPPPALGLMSLNVMAAANALLIPIPAQYPDLSSTTSYLRMMERTLKTLERHNGPHEYKFTRAVITRFDEGNENSAQSVLAQVYETVFGTSLLRARFRQTKQIENAYSRQRTVYELTKEEVNRAVHKRALSILDTMFIEIELLIRRTWPSHEKKLRQEGKV